MPTRLLSGLKKSCRVARVKPLAQVNAPPACRPCEKRLVAFICKESYLELPVADPVGFSAPNCGNG